MALRYIRGRFRARPAKVAQNVLGIEENFEQLQSIVSNSNATLSQRVSAASMIRSSIDQNSLSSIPEVWYSVVQLLNLENPPELRRAGWKLVVSCIEHDEINAGSYNSYYHAIIDNCNVEDFDLVLETLEALTQGGRNLANTPTANYRLPTVLSYWLNLLALRTQELETNPNARDIAEQWGRSTPENFLRLLKLNAQILKFNMSCFDEKDIEKSLLQTAAVVKISNSEPIMEACCALISTIMAFGLIPLNSLDPVLQVLCAASRVNEAMDEIVWKSVNDLIKSHLGHSTVQRLCRILDSHESDVLYVMRSASAALLCRVLVEGAEEEAEELPVVEVFGAYSNALDHMNSELCLEVATSLRRILESKKLCHHISFDIWQSAALSPLTLLWKLGEYASSTAYKITLDAPEQFRDEAPDLKKLEAVLTDLLELVLVAVEPKDSIVPLDETIAITGRLSQYVSCSSALKVVALFNSLHLCSPYMEDWQDKTNLLLSKFYKNDALNGAVREKIIALCEPLLMMPDNEEQVLDIVDQLFTDIRVQDSQSVISLLSAYREIAQYGRWTLFERATRLLVKLFPAQSSARSSDDQTSQALEKIASSLVEAFLSLFQTSSRKATLLYGALLDVCAQSVFDERPFKVAFSLLCRLRVDASLCVCVTEPAIEDDYGAALCQFQVQLPMKKSLRDKHSLVLKRSCKGLEEEHHHAGEPHPQKQPEGLDTSLLLGLVTSILEKNAPEQVYILVLLNVPTQLGNVQFYNGCDGELVNFRNFLFRQCTAKLPIAETSITRPEIIAVYIHMVTLLMGHSRIFTKQDYDKMLQTLVKVMNEWDKTTANWTLHCLVICCYECPVTLQRFLPQILAKLQTRITSKDSSTHIMEFLLTLSLVEVLTSSFNMQEFKRVFGICFTYIQNARDTLSKSSNVEANILSQYLLRLAHTTISYLFLGIDIRDREQIVSYLIRSFALSSKEKGVLDPLNLCTYDLLCRYTYSNQPLSLTSRAAELNRYTKDKDNSSMWMIGSSILEFTTNKLSGKSFIIVRRPTCTLVTALKPIDGSLIMVSDPASLQQSDELVGTDQLQFRSQFWLQMSRGLNEGTASPMYISPTTAHTRAVSSLDRAPVVEFYKVGVIYIGPGQKQEHEILANVCGSGSYRRFLTNLGQFVRLKGNRDIYAGGLDTENNIDGEFTVAWVGKISQITFHVITMMPNPEHDTSLSSKKRHIGNNYVNIYFDESGTDFNFDIVKSQFNFINIVVSPTYSPGKFRVRAYRKEGLANVLAAYESKVVDEEHLALFVRHLAVKATIYAKVYNQNGDYTDEWLYRLELITKLRNRIVAENTEEAKAEEQNGVAKNPTERGEQEEPEYLTTMLEKLDFTSYTKF